MKRRLRLITGIIAAIALGFAVWIDRSQQPAPRESVTPPPPVFTDAASPTDAAQGRSSENYQIVEDSTEGFAASIGEFVTSTGETAPVPNIPAVQTNALVTRAKDGDTIVAMQDVSASDRTGGTEVTVRLLGVNTPESVDPRKPVECFGKEASAFTTSKLDGVRVRLDADPQADERDKYGRLLRNVTLEDGTDFNALLVSEGYAYAYLSFPLNPARKVELKKLEEGAKEAKRGLWAEGACAK
ncbi:MAG TPA: thermonuclease family protein [Candidatus Methylomirabilis sp.]|nr:thermonuclease family protein [Candidatus Methylomirabilis sp.]